MVVKAKLEGHVFDLDALVELFREGEPKVAKEEDGYYLASSELDGLMDDGGPLVEAATRLLQKVTGIARILDSSFRPVTMPGTFVEDSGDGGRRRQHVAGALTAELRIKASFVASGVVSTSDGRPPEPEPSPAPPEGPLFIQLAASHPDVAEALEILGKSSISLNWVDLYKLYEIVRSNVGGEKALKQWASSADLSAFTASANRPDVSGSEARHARSTGARLPKRTMNLAEGEAFIRRLIETWWNSLVSQSED